MLVAHIIISSATLLFAVANFKHTSRSIYQDGIKIFGGIMMAALTLSSGVVLVVQGTNLVRVCIAGTILLAFTIYSIFRVYRKSQIRLEL